MLEIPQKTKNNKISLKFCNFKIVGKYSASIYKIVLMPNLSITTLHTNKYIKKGHTKGIFRTKRPTPNVQLHLCMPPPFESNNKNQNIY